MNHSFDVGVAKQHGVGAAALFQTLVFWIGQNRAEGRNFQAGRYWSYNSYRAMTRFCPYLSADQLRRCVERLVAGGLLIKRDSGPGRQLGNWYALANEGLWLGEVEGGATGETAAGIEGEIAGLEAGNDANLGGVEAGKSARHPGKFASLSNTNQIQTQSTHSSGRPDRGETAILVFLKEKTGKSFRINEPNLRLIRARLAEGYSPDELRWVVERKCLEWGGTPRAEYLRPATLFGREKFAQYVGEMGQPPNMRAKNGDNFYARAEESARRAYDFDRATDF